MAVPNTTIPLSGSGERIGAVAAADGLSKTPVVALDDASAAAIDGELNAATVVAGVGTSNGDVPGGKKIRKVVVVAPVSTDATVAIQGNPAITVPAGTVFIERYKGLAAIAGNDVVVVGSASWYAAFE
jgi:hypothetical protein